MKIFEGDIQTVFLKTKNKPHFDPNQVRSRDPYQSIDLIEYYKSCNMHKELEHGRQALEGVKVNIFRFFLQILREFF